MIDPTTAVDTRKKLSLFLDATGHQIFANGLYNGDPHPGNILVLIAAAWGSSITVKRVY